MYVPINFYIPWTRHFSKKSFSLSFAVLKRSVVPFSSARTTDAQWGNRLHCSAENQIPIPNLSVQLKYILSATSAQNFRVLWFMPSLGVRSPFSSAWLHFIDKWVTEFWHFFLAFPYKLSSFVSLYFYYLFKRTLNGQEKKVL